MVVTVMLCERCRWAVRPGDDFVVAVPTTPGISPEALGLDEIRGEPPAVFHRRCWNPADRHWRRSESPGAAVV